jgi:hypothetical protein
MPALEMALVSWGSFGPASVFTQSPSVSTLESTTMKTKFLSLTASAGDSGPLGDFAAARSMAKPVMPILSVRPPSRSLM